ncbi:MAG: fasciclin domain-containing protein [Bacteroidaceae bacterium]|nr:fasciclin domain-containing protein [Bacteroidaceae bacterium]
MKKLFLIFSVVALIGCTEDIDTSNRYVFKEQTAMGYLKKHAEDYSTYVDLLYKIPVSSVSKTTVGQLLSARGHYTIFAPTNEAIQDYLDTLVVNEVIPEASWDAFPNEATRDSIEKVIVLNSVIDSGDDYNAYEIGSFPTTQDAEIPIPNMYDRKLNIHYNDETNEDILVNNCAIDENNRDIPVINGFIHAVKKVIAPSNNTLATLFTNIKRDNIEGYHVMALLVHAVGLIDSLQAYRDEVYEELYLAGMIPDENFTYKGYAPRHRYFGFTCFAETDEFWSQTLGKPALDITVEDVREYVAGLGVYPDAVDDDDYENENNLLNRFVTYHFLPERLATDRLVLHYNEKGNNPTTRELGVAMCEYYTTMGKRRLMKLYESRESRGVYINRFPLIDNGRHGTYHEIGCDPGKEGIKVGEPNLEGENNVRNGIIYPIDKLLVYDEDTRNSMGKSRIRFDVTNMWPEFMNNDIRVSEITDERHLRVSIPNDTQYPYLDDLRISEDTYFIYWTARGWGWSNYLGDEVNIQGNLDVTMRLPPVPRYGTYELRFACQNGGEMGNRGIFQFYWGSDLGHLAPMGIPLDLQIGSQYRSTKAGYFPSNIGWVVDTDDDDYNIDVDKIMRNNGFMKGPEIYIAGSPGGTITARNSNICSRRIIITQQMDPDKTYYLRFKTCLDDPKREYYVDYLEFCPKEVYDNPETPEDIW